jgi:hypothetical protein
MTDTIEPSGLPELTPAEAAAIFDTVDANPLLALAGTRGKPKLDESALVTDSGPLTAEHLAIASDHLASGQPLGTQAPTLKAIRHSHHRLAQMLAMGIDESRAALMCNYSVSRVSILKSDPAFQELLAYYSDKAGEQWSDFVAAASGLSLDMLQELQRQLDEQPEKFTPGQLLEGIKVLADRTGHAPVTKSVQVNVNTDFGSRLDEARKRAQQLAQGGPDVIDV